MADPGGLGLQPNGGESSDDASDEDLQAAAARQQAEAEAAVEAAVKATVLELPHGLRAVELPDAALEAAGGSDEQPLWLEPYVAEDLPAECRAALDSLVERNMRAVLAGGHCGIKRRSQSKRAQRYLRSQQLFPSTFR